MVHSQIVVSDVIDVISELIELINIFISLQEKPIKMFVGRLPNDVKKEDIEEYFSKYGELKDVYIPQPFRNFAFITYANSEDGFRVLRDSHVLDVSYVSVDVPL